MKNIKKAVDIDNKKIVHDGCMITVSGIVIDLLNPNPDLILIEDIAHGLAHNCRWNGHTQKFWSIAQHSVMMYNVAPKKDRLAYLFHDAEEAYWGDMIKPLKNIIQEKCPEILAYMKEMRKIIYTKFDIPYTYDDPAIGKHDYNCLIWEFEHIIKTSDAIYWWTPEEAKKEWLYCYNHSK